MRALAAAEERSSVSLKPYGIPTPSQRIELYRCGPGLSTGLPQSDLREGAGLRGLPPAIIQLSRVRREAEHPAA